MTEAEMDDECSRAWNLLSDNNNTIIKNERAEEAFAIFHSLAIEGHVESQFRVGWMLSRIQGVPIIYVVARGWFMKAAKNKHIKAHYELGLMCERGNGARVNNLDAFIWYSRAIRIGFTTERTDGITIIDDQQEVVDARNRVGENLSVEDRVDAEEKVEEWLNEYFPDL